MWQKFKNLYHLVVAVLANTYFGFPSRKFRVVGVTGTDGKTTTVSLIYHILKMSGLNVSMISTVGAIINGRKSDLGFHVTTPSSWEIQKTFALAAKSSKSQVMILEVTSHALDQFRVWGVSFEIGVLTNVAHEHLDYHKSYENYVKTKAKLLKISKITIMNRDDKSYESINNRILSVKDKQKIITYGLNSNSDINPESFPFSTNLIGEFNKYNALAAISTCRTLGIEDRIIRNALKSFKPPTGREDVVYKKDFTVMIDFAHTPNAFEGILSSIKPEVIGRIIHVFGSAGLRDKTKRPQMGRISSKYADIIIVTSEDPRTENVEDISEQIISGISNRESWIKNGTLLRIEDRKEAIYAGISMARKGDTVIITGKDHEKSMNYGHGEEPWDEYRTALDVLERRIKEGK